MSAYGALTYWEDRYRRDSEPFDWYQRYSALKETLTKYIRKSDAVLMVGCGSSRLTEDMYEDGYSSITNVDYAGAVIDAMATRYRDKKGLTWAKMDVTSLALHDASFDAVIDKGTLDSILCGENSAANATKACSEVSRVLKTGGSYIVISYGTPESRLAYLEREELKWRVTVHTIPKPTIAGAANPADSAETAVHYIYICHKTA